MTVRRKSLAAVALLALLLGASCSDRETTSFSAETDEPDFRRGQQLEKEGREPEALTSFLKVIEKRGEQNAPESHLHAGLIDLQRIKDPVEAIHHFRKFLELQPNSPEASLVRQQRDAAVREFASTLPARPAENQSVRVEAADELEQLRRDNAEMRAELSTLHGGNAIPVTHPSRMLTLPLDPSPRVSAPAVSDSPITPAPVHPSIQPAPRAATAAAAATRVAAPAGRTHAVAPGESLWSIAGKYYGKTNASQVQAILDANRDVLREAKDLKPGMTLRIPNP